MFYVCDWLWFANENFCSIGNLDYACLIHMCTWHSSVYLIMTSELFTQRPVASGKQSHYGFSVEKSSRENVVSTFGLIQRFPLPLSCLRTIISLENMELVYNVLIANWTPNYSTYSSNYLNIYLGNITNIFMYFTFENIAGKVQFSFFKLSFKFFLYKTPIISIFYLFRWKMIQSQQTTRST